MNDKFAIQNRINEAKSSILQAMSCLSDSMDACRPMKKRELSMVFNQLVNAYDTLYVAMLNHKEAEGIE